jgi:hypothetical protein
MERVQGDIRSQKIVLTKLLDSGDYSITTIGQVTEAKLVIKSGNSIIITKTLANNQLAKDTPNKAIVIYFTTGDFGVGKLEKNKSYTIGFGIKYGALVDFVPIPLTFSSSTLKILPSPLI